MKCEAEKAAEKIKNDKDMTQREILQYEIIIRHCFSTCSNLNKVFNLILMRKKRQEDEKNDPTTNEEDKKAAKPKKRWFSWLF